MNPAIFLPGFDGDARLRGEFVRLLSRRRETLAVSYPNRCLATIDGYCAHAMAHSPVDWRPVLLAESFSGLVAARWASIDPRVAAVVLCGCFARNPVSVAAQLGAAWPALVKLGPRLTSPLAAASADPRRRRWSAGFTRALDALDDDVVAERLRLIATEDASQPLAALRVPLLLVQFQQDLVVGRSAREHLESVCHNAHVLRLPGPHFALETRPEECAQAIEARLAAMLAPGT